MKVQADWPMVVVCAVFVAGSIAAFAMSEQEVGYALAGLALGLFGRQPVEISK